MQTQILQHHHSSSCCHTTRLQQQQQQPVPLQPPCRPLQQQQQPQQRLRHLQHRQQHVLTVAAASGDDPPPSKEDRANPNKADFSAYWSLKFREFFSKRRQYLQLARKRQEPPEIFKKIDEQIRVQEEKLEAARMQAR